MTEPMVPCPNCDGGGETGGHYGADDGMETCRRCDGTGSLPMCDVAREEYGKIAYNSYVSHETMREQGRKARVPYTYVSWEGLSPEMREVWYDVVYAVMEAFYKDRDESWG